VQKRFSTEGSETAPKYAFQGLTRSSATAAKQRVSYAASQVFLSWLIMSNRAIYTEHCRRCTTKLSAQKAQHTLNVSDIIIRHTWLIKFSNITLRLSRSPVSVIRKPLTDFVIACITNSHMSQDI